MNQGARREYSTGNVQDNSDELAQKNRGIDDGDGVGSSREKHFKHNKRPSRISFLAPFRFGKYSSSKKFEKRESTPRISMGRFSVTSFGWLGDEIENDKKSSWSFRGFDVEDIVKDVQAVSSTNEGLSEKEKSPHHGENQSDANSKRPPTEQKKAHNQDTADYSYSIDSDILEATADRAQKYAGVKRKSEIQRDLNQSLQVAAKAKRRSALLRQSCLGLLLVLLIVGILLAAVLSNQSKKKKSNEKDEPKTSTTIHPATTPVALPTMMPSAFRNPENPVVDTQLSRVQQRGLLRCGIAEMDGFAQFDLQAQTFSGMDADLCRAVSAAIFGLGDDPERVTSFLSEHTEFVLVNSTNRFKRLADASIDLMTATTTHTMEREVFEPSTQRGYDFSTPYLYGGLQFAGQAEFVECVESQSASDDCAGTTVCLLEATTHISVVQKRNPSVTVVLEPSLAQLYQSFIQGRCNVIAGEQVAVSEVAMRESGYNGTDYVIGNIILSKEPLALVTRNDDAQWSDFVRWVVQALLAAEEEGIFQRTAGLLQLTDAFGPGLEGVFASSVAAVGSYAEMYERNLEAVAPRKIGNTINRGASGLIYSFPLGDVEAVGPGPSEGGTMERILERGHLNCGVALRDMFAVKNETSGEYNGFDADYCKLLSAALFGGATDKVEYTDLSSGERFVALAKGTVDVLSRITTHTFQRDVLEDASGVGLSFSHPNFYDGMTFGGEPGFVQCADELDTTSIRCRNLRVCVEADTTFEHIMKGLFPEEFVVPHPQISIGIAEGKCNAIAGGIGDVAGSVIRAAGYQGEYKVGLNRYSKDPLALVTRQDDPQWTSFVNWLVDATFYAEEQGITKSTGDRMPDVHLFGEMFSSMFRDAIAAVGSYGEIYNRSIASEIPRSGLHFLNTELGGPQHYPLPGVV